MPATQGPLMVYYQENSSIQNKERDGMYCVGHVARICSFLRNSFQEKKFIVKNERRNTQIVQTSLTLRMKNEF